MQTVKDQMTKVIEQQADDASYEEILRELAFERMVLRGLADRREGRMMTNEDMGDVLRKMVSMQ